MKKIFAATLVAILSFSAAASADEARLLRFPATNSSEVVFSFGGDLYSAPLAGGEAKRLTSHIGYEMFARYSPDGRSIAFTGEYDGNREVYLIPSQGGSPVRLTYTSTNERDDLGDRMGPNNIVMAWNPDGKSIVYRNRIGEGFEGKLWTVSPEGGMPSEIKLPEGGFCCWSPDGKKLAYNRVMREFRTWKYYRGGMADDIWIYDPKAGKVENITSNDAQDIFPMWVGEEIYFASDRDMTMNIFVYNTRTGETAKVTDFKEFDVKFPSTDGKTIVFENGGYIWKLDPATKKVEQIHITLTSDDIYGRTEMIDVSGRTSSMSAAPDGSHVVVTARGEVFCLPVGRGVTRNLSRTPGSNDRSASWSPDGKYIAWIGDGTGETEVYLYDVEKGGDPVQITRDNDTYIRSLQWSPDSKHILYSDRKNRLVEVDPAAKTKRTVMTCPESEFRGVSYSPDSKWLTYTKPAANEFGIVYVYDLSADKEYAVTDRWYSSDSPVFSTDGKYLIFSSDRDVNASYSRVEWNYSVSNMSGIYMAMLTKDTPSPLLLKDVMPAQGKSGDRMDGPMGPPFEDELVSGEQKHDRKMDKPGQGPEGKHPEMEDSGATDGPKSDKKEVSVSFDPEGISERIVKLPVRGGGRNFYCDGKKVWYSTMGGTSVYDLETGSNESCTDGQLYYRSGDRKAIVRKGGSLMVGNFGPKVNAGEKVDMSDMKATVDYTAEWPQIFDEVWRAFRDGFYLENMHGRDWKAVKAKYAQLLPYVTTRLDLNYIIGEMISELACGHAYVNVGDYPKPEKIQMGLLGAEMSKDAKSGYFRIDRILQGAPYAENLNSPLAQPGLEVEAGSYITAINGVSTKDVANIYSMLVGKAGVFTELTVNTKAAEGGKKIVVKPISDEYPLYHYEWVQKCIKTVEEKSDGKVGYIYIPDMGPEGLSEFIRYYYPQLDKEALIIDDRGNGGGNISPMIIERLQREVYRMTMSRTSSMTGTTPDGTHTGPKVLLMNKYSASDGDLFPWSFKANSLGTTVGTRTWGGIIGISGSLPYMDGTDVRVPFFTNYDARTGEWIVENHGVDPDIVLDNDPVKEYSGEDQQLLKAIEVALEQIKDRKPLPGVPAPRTFKDLGLPETK